MFKGFEPYALFKIYKLLKWSEEIVVDKKTSSAVNNTTKKSYTIAEITMAVTYSGSTDENRLTIEFIRAGQVIDTSRYDMFLDTNPTDGLRSTLSGFATPDDPESGIHTYSIRYSAASTGSASFSYKFHRQLIELVEYRR